MSGWDTAVSAGTDVAVETGWAVVLGMLMADPVSRTGVGDPHEAKEWRSIKLDRAEAKVASLHL